VHHLLDPWLFRSPGVEPSFKHKLQQPNSAGIAQPLYLSHLALLKVIKPLHHFIICNNCLQLLVYTLLIIDPDERQLVLVLVLLQLAEVDELLLMLA